MNDFDYRLLGSLAAIVTLWGGILIAAAKSIFITKLEFSNLMEEIKLNNTNFDRKLYDSHNLPLYVLRTEWASLRVECNKKYDSSHYALLQKIDNMMDYLERMRKDVEETKISLSKLETVIGERRKGELYES